MPALNHKQAAFVREYLICGNATQAAVKAGYSASTAKQQGSRLLTNVDVQAAIAKGREKVVAKAEAQFDLTLNKVLAEYQRIAMTGMSRFMHVDADGTPRIDLSACTPADLDLLAEVTVEEFTSGRGEDAREVRRVKIKPLDRLNALEKLGKHLGMADKAGNEAMSDLASALTQIARAGSSAPVKGS